MLYLLKYALFELLRLAFVSVQRKIVWRLKGIDRVPPKRPVRQMKIIYRLKRDAEEISRCANFISVHQSFETDTILLNDSTCCWAMYSFDQDWAYFVQMDRPIRHYSIRSHPFIYTPMFFECKKLAEISISHLIELAAKIEQQQQQKHKRRKIVFVTSTARSGSTLLGRMLHHDGHSTVFAECYPLTLLSLCLVQNSLPRNKLKALLKATILVLSQHIGPSELCIFKTASSETRLVPLLDEICAENPTVFRMNYIFLFRAKGLESNERMLARDKTIVHFVRWAALCRFIWPLYRYCAWQAIGWLAGSDCIRELKPDSMKEWAAIVYGLPYSDYLKYQWIYKSSPVLHSELVNGKTVQKVLQTIFDRLGLPRHLLTNAVDCLKTDSQKDTYLSQKEMQSIRVTKMTPKIATNLRRIARKLHLPSEHFFDSILFNA